MACGFTNDLRRNVENIDFYPDAIALLNWKTNDAHSRLMVCRTRYVCRLYKYVFWSLDTHFTSIDPTSRVKQPRKKLYTN